MPYKYKLKDNVPFRVSDTPYGGINPWGDYPTTTEQKWREYTYPGENIGVQTPTVGGTEPRLSSAAHNN